MAFVFSCNHCRKPVTANEEQRGLLMACPHCAGQFVVPGKPATERRSEEATKGAAKAPTLGHVAGIGDAPSVDSSDWRSGIAPSLRRAFGPSVRVPLDALSVRFSFSCLRCGSILEAKGDMCGQKGRCPTCGAVFTVPQVDPLTGLATSAAEVADDGQLPTPMHAYANAGNRAPKVVRKADGTQAIVCPRCSRQMPIDANICTACGIPFTMEGASTVEHSTSSLNPQAGWALTLGVLSLLTFCLPILGVPAIVVGLLALKKAEVYGNRGGRGMAIVGIVFGAISLVGFGIFFWIKYL